MTSGRPPRHLLMVMPYHQLVRKAVEAGFRVWSVWDPALREKSYLDEVERHSEELLTADFGDHAALRGVVAEAARRYGIDAVLHLGGEDTMLPVAEEAEALGLAVNPASAVRSLNDKAATRALLNTAGVSVVRAREVTDAAQAADALAEFTLPVIIKPTRLAGSRGIALIRDPADLLEWNARVERDGHRGPYLVEEYLEGPEFSVETLSAGCVHHIVGITAKRTGGAPYFVESGHIHPAPLSAADAEALRATVLELLDLAGYAFGPAHTEVVLTSRGPRVVESQARLGGDRIPLLVDVASGFDIEAGIFRALAGEPLAPPTPVRTAAIGFFQLPPGTVEAAEGTEDIARLPHVHALHFPWRAGDTLPATVSSATRHGYAVVDGATPDEAAERLAEVERLVRSTLRTSAPSAPRTEGSLT
ncbi:MULTISPECIES: ATP-grasp domain-containing protein [unclassified Streptomyces]|uniref:ATP-grasp domain-containing protein n=1 Tax=unclassified Streptomyces TaxID=2593676 RepID=UPI00093C5D24|nr:ATP-grasp domain-containing protein [Streptomyces sp. TSRI0281]OKI43937.1 phosphoribosylglycinamide synthetase [Streptomyces sp. TSRI0281]